MLLVLTHWGRVTHICVSKLTIIGSDNGLSPGRRQAITWTNVGILLIGPLGTNFSKMLIEIHISSFKKMRLKMSYARWRPSCLGLNVLSPNKDFIRYDSPNTLSWFDGTINYLSPNISFYTKPFQNTEMVQLVWNRGRKGPVCPTAWASISWLLMPWRRKKPGHQQPCYSSSICHTGLVWYDVIWTSTNLFPLSSWLLSSWWPSVETASRPGHRA